MPPRVPDPTLPVPGLQAPYADDLTGGARRCGRARRPRPGCSEVDGAGNSQPEVADTRNAVDRREPNAQVIDWLASFHRMTMGGSPAGEAKFNRIATVGN
jgi:hypothetical protein